jgi:hypothetical protein
LAANRPAIPAMSKPDSTVDSDTSSADSMLHKALEPGRTMSRTRP